MIRTALGAPTFDYCNVEKSRWLTQTGPSTLVPAARSVVGPGLNVEGPFEFWAMAGHRGAINGANVTPPNRAAAPLLPFSIPNGARDDVVAYFPFSGDANDASGHYRDGVVIGATLAADRFGTPNSAYRLLTGHRIDVPGISPDQFANAFSFGGWIRWDDGSPSFINWGAAGSPSVAILYDIGPGAMRFWTGWGAMPTGRTIQTEGIADGQWHHVFITHGSSVDRAYINGQLAGEFPTFPLAGSAAPMHIGRDSFAVDMTVDDIAVFSSELTAAEVRMLFEGTLNLAPVDELPGLVKVVDFATQAAMDAAYPDGEYLFNVDTIAAGPVTRTLNLQGTYPNAPQFSNYAAAQEVDAGQDFTLSFNAFEGLGQNDQIFIRVYDSSGFIAFGWFYSFNDQGTSVVIPAGTLSPGAEYTAQVIFLKAVERRETPEPNFEVNLADYVSATSMRLATKPLDVTLYLVEKTRWRRQTGPATVVEAATSPAIFGTVDGAYEFFSMVTFGAGGAGNAASVQIPSGPIRTMSHFPARDVFATLQNFPSLAEMEAAIPNGNFTIQATAGAGTPHSGTLTLSGDAYPPVPQFNNYAAAQAIDTEQPFVLLWNPFAGATADDVILLRIFNASGALVFETPATGPDALGIAAVSKDLPANTLQPGQTYTAQLLFFKTADLEFAAIPNAVGVAEYGSVTSMQMQTTQCAAPADGLQAWWRGEGNSNDSIGGRITSLNGPVGFAAGKVGQTFAFANASYLQASDALPLRPTRLSVSLWARATAPAAGKYVLAKSYLGNLSSYGMSIVNGVGLVFNVGNAGSPPDASPWTGTWKHFVGTYDGSHVRLYLNGVQLGNGTAFAGPIPYGTTYQNGDLMIGTFQWGNGFYFWPGDLDEVMVWDRALTGAEIAAIYNAGVAGVCEGPVVTTFPTDLAARTGQTAQFTVAANSPLPLRYQWQRDRVDMPGETNPTLALNNVQPDQAGRYRVVVATDAGTTTTADAQLIVDTCAVAPDNLVGWWRGEGNINDTAGGLNGTASAGMPYVSGQSGQAFGTSAGFARIPNHERLRPAQITASAWVRSTSIANFQYVLSKSYDGSASSYAFYTANGGFGFYVRAGGSARVAAATLPADGVWRHVVGTYDGSTVRLYINGAQAGSVAANLPIDYGAALQNGDLLIGAVYDEANTRYYWPGSVDEVMLFNRALSIAEIQAIYNARTAGLCVGPTITTFPAPVTTVVNAQAQFTVGAASDTPITYQWQRNGVDIPGATSATYTIAAAQLADAGQYRAVATDANGSTVTATVTLQVDQCAPAPNGLAAWWRAEGSANEAINSLHGAASGTLAYTAGQSGQAFQTQNGMARVPNSALLRPTQLTFAAWVKRVATPVNPYIVSKSYSGTYSSYAMYAGASTLYFYIGGPSTYHPMSAPITWDDRWRHVAATYDGTAMRLYIDGALAGSSPLSVAIQYGAAAYSGDLFIGGVYPATPQYYWPGAIDEAMIFSRALTEPEIAAMYNARTAGLCPGPSITVQPVSDTVLAGAAAQFQVTAISQLPLRYQWQFNGADIPGQTASSLTISQVTAQNAGRYRVIVTDDAGSVISDEAILDVDICAPAPAGLAAWWRGEGNIDESLAGLPSVSSGSFAYAAGEVGQAFSTANGYFRVTDNERLRPANLTVAVWLKGPPTTGDQYVLSKSNHNAYHSYSLQAAGGQIRFNIGTASAFYTVSAPIAWDTRWRHIAATYDGATLRLLIDGVEANALAVNLPIQYGTTDHEGSLLIGSDFGGYSWGGGIDELMIFNRALATAEVASIYASRSAGLCVAPVITSQPISRNVTAGANALFEVTATAPFPLRYQWQFNEADLPGETSRTLTLNAVTPARAGRYRVIVSDDDGSVASAEAVLEVDVCLAPPANLVGRWKGDGTAADSFQGLASVGEPGLVYAEGKVGQALQTANGVVRVANSPALSPAKLTLTAWVKRGPTAGGFAVTKFFDPFYAPSYAIKGTSTTLSFVLATGGWWDEVSIPVTWNNQWMHVAGTYDGVTARMYVNGVLAGTPVVLNAPIDYGNFYDNGDLFIGGYTRTVPEQPQFNWPGLLDDVMIFNRALSAGEIAGLYEAGAASICNGISILRQPAAQTMTAGSTARFDVGIASAAMVDIAWQRNGQTIAAGPTLSIPNAQIADAGRYRAVISNADGTVYSDDAELVVTSPVTPALAGGIGTGGDARRVHVVGNIAYVANVSSGFRIVDVTDKANPQLRGSLPSRSTTWDVKVAGTVAYIADGGAGLQLANVADPANPTRLGEADTQGSANGLDVVGNYAYIADGFSGFAVADVSNPNAPQIVGTVDTPGNANHVHVVGNYAYVADMDRGLQIIDVSVPSNPRIVGARDTNGEAYDVSVSGNYAYLAHGTIGLMVMDVSNPTNPTEVTAFDTSGQALGISVQGRYAFLADFNEGLKVIDVLNPASPSQAYALDTPGEGRGVFVSGNFAYVADGNSGLQIIRISETPVLPEITGQPWPLRMAAGQSAFFKVDATGDQPLAYQWQFNGSDIPGQTTADLIIDAITEAHEGRYRVIVSNASGSVTSDEATLVVDQCIASPPGLEGYWPADGVLLNYAGDTRGELLNGATFAEGFSGQAFTFDGVDDRVSLGNEVGNFGSENFAIAFWARGPMERAETLVLKGAGEFGFGLVSADGFVIGLLSGIDPVTNEGNSLQVVSNRRLIDQAWHHLAFVRRQDRIELYIDGQLDGTVVSTEARVNSDSADNFLLGGSVFLFNHFTGAIDELMLFRRALSAAEINAIYGSGVASLCPIPTAPAVGRPEGGGSAIAGLPWTLSAVTDGFGPFTYQWRRNGVIIAGATGPTLQIVGATAADAGDYFVVVTGPFGIRASEPTRLQVMGPPVITQQPASQSVRVGPGYRLVLEATIAGDGPFAYQWIKDNADLPTATGPRLEFSPTTPSVAGTYRLRVSNAAGSGLSDPAVVTLRPALEVTRPPANVQTGEGNPLDLSVEVAGTGPFEFQWRLNGQNIPGATLANYHLDSMALQNAGQYTVAITDPGGAVTSDPAEVTLVSVISVEPADAFANAFSLNGQPPQIRTSNIEATRELGEPEHADKPGQHSIWFAWLAPANGQLEIKTIGSSFDTLLGIYKGTAFPLESVAIGDDEGGFATSAALANVENGIRYFIAVDGLGDARGTVLLTWNFRAAAPAPSIRIQPQSVTTTIGAEVRLAIDARDVESYQWRRNEAPIAGATGPDYTIVSVQLADLGVYDVVLTGGGVSIASQPVEVQVGTDAEVLAFDKLFDRLNSIDLAAPAPARAAAADPTSPPRAAVGFGSAAAARGLVGVPGSHQDSTIGATRDPGEPNHAGEAGGASTWFVIQADADATMEVTTDGSSFDTVLAIYSGPETVLLFSQLELRAADNNSGANGRTSRVVIPVARNAFYYCAIDGVQGASGFVRINYRLGLAPVIQENPAPQSVLVRGAALMRGSALNADAQDLQWYFNGAPLAGRVGTELQIPDVQSTDAGVYTVVAETFAGRAVSQPATLTVRPAQAIRVSSPTIGANGIRVRVQGGSSQPIRAQASANLINWVEVPVEILPDGTVIVGPAPGLGSGAQFFRIVQ